MKNKKSILILISTVFLGFSCTNPTSLEPNKPGSNDIVQSQILLPPILPVISTPTCDTRRFNSLLVNTSTGLELDNYISPVVCPPTDGGDGYLRITTYNDPVLSVDGFEFIIEKWDENDSRWEFYFYAGVVYFDEAINIFESDANGNAFNGLEGDERFRLKIYRLLAPGTGGGILTTTDDIRVIFDLND
jgi:hypothetical protein